jgi:hypothetical protein
MTEFSYLPKGLSAMVRAHQVSAMSGHLGAAVVSGYFIGDQQPDLDKRVYRGIEAELKRIIRGEVVAFSRKSDSSHQAPTMFEPFAKERPNESLIEGIADALSRNIDRVRESGHNVIFSSIAIRGLKDHPDLAAPSVVDGIRRLIGRFNDASPGSGYFGKARGRIDGRRVFWPMMTAFHGSPTWGQWPTPSCKRCSYTLRNSVMDSAGFGISSIMLAP